MTGVRGRVVLTVLVVTACLYSLLGSIGFLQIAHSGRDAIRDRVAEVVDQLEAGLRIGSGTTIIQTADGVQAAAITPGASIPTGDDIRVERTVEIDSTTILLVGHASQARLTDSLRSLHRGLWIGIPLAVLLTTLAAGLSIRRALRPVSEITELAATIGNSDTTSRVPVPPTDDEVEHLARTVNEMLDRIAAGRAVQQQFTSDAAHELRTPLMALQGEIELAQRGASADAAFLDRIDAQTVRLAARVDDLVLLSTLDERAPLSITSRDLLDLVHAETDPEMIVVGGSVVVDVDARLAQRAVRNLVANARRHARSQVQVVVEALDDRVWVHVDDDGPGISADQREAVFRRFGRLDAARHGDAGGAGLGLAIVASVAQSHGGGVAAGDGPLGGARVSMWFSSHGGANRGEAMRD